MARLLAAVADGGARLDGALALDRAGAQENRFEQRGLAALERAHQRDAPGTRRSCAVLCHLPPPYLPEMRPSRNSLGRITIVSGRRGDWQEAACLTRFGRRAEREMRLGRRGGSPVRRVSWRGTAEYVRESGRRRFH